MTTASTQPSTAPSGWLASAGWLTAGHAATVGLRLVGLLIVARRLGIEAIGAVGVGLSAAAGLSMLFSGTQTAAIIEATRHPHLAAAIRRRAVRQQLAIAATAYVGYAGIVIALGTSHTASLLVFGLGAFVQATMLRWLLVAGGEARIAGLVVAAGATVFVVGCVVMVHDPHGVFRVAVLHVAVEAAIAGVLWQRSEQLCAPAANGLSAAPSVLTELAVGRTLRLSLLQFARIAPITLSVVTIALVAGEVEAGRFALPQRAALAAFAVTALFTEAGTGPLIGRAGSAARIRQTTLPIAVVAIAAALLALVIANPVVDVVLADDRYRGMGPVAALLALALGLALSSGPRVQVGLAAGHDRSLLWASVTTSVATVGLGAAFVATVGVTGIGIAEFVGQLAFFVAVIAIGRR